MQKYLWIYTILIHQPEFFGGTHTTLGFSSAMSKRVAVIERDMKLKNILAHFMVDIKPESKHDCFAAQTVNMMLRFVAPEFSHKPWNYYKPFLDSQKKKVEIFLNDTKVSNELKVKRVKLEMKFVCDCSTTLPKSDHIFCIQVTLPNKKRCDKSAFEFADSLMAYLGRKTDKKAVDHHSLQYNTIKCNLFSLNI